jgi:hypothetical protein
MRRNFETVDYGATLAQTISLREALPASHLARFIVKLVAQLEQLQEGLPANLRLALLVAWIFIGAKFGATLLGYAVLGAYLGLRPGDPK